MERGLKILEFFGESARRITLTEVALGCSINKAATQRFLHTFCKLGYLIRDNDKKYQLSSKILSLGFGFLNSSELKRICKSHIDILSSKINRNVSLGILDDYEVIYLYRAEVQRILKFDLYAGTRIPAHCCSMGKVLLASLNDGDLNEFLNSVTLKPITSETIISKNKLLDEISETRKRGYSVSDRELSMDLYSMAVPILDADQIVIAALNASIEICDKETVTINKVRRELVNSGAQISKEFGYRGPYPMAFKQIETNQYRTLLSDLFVNNNQKSSMKI